MTKETFWDKLGECFASINNIVECKTCPYYVHYGHKCENENQWHCEDSLKALYNSLE